MMQQLAIPVSDASQIGEARRAAALMAAHAALPQTETGRLAIISTELATNLVRYGQRGMILVRANAPAPGSLGCVELLAIDSGPGMDIARCLVDGYSTGGTPGNGLGAVQRLASEFDIFSASPGGTVIMARISAAERPAPQPLALRWGYISLPNAGESVCGDSGAFWQNHHYASLMIADGLGHGPDAAAASTPATAVFHQNPALDPAALIDLSHRALSGSRGAAVAVARLDHAKSVLHYAGVGNIAGTLLAVGTRRGLPSLNGIVGAILPKVRAFEYPLPLSGMLIMHSDGLLTRWSLEPYAGLTNRHPALVAAVLYRDFYRGRDDVTILVGAWRGGAA